MKTETNQLIRGSGSVYTDGSMQMIRAGRMGCTVFFLWSLSDFFVKIMCQLIYLLNVACSMINKNSETDIGVHPEDQKSKVASHWLLPLLSQEMVILPPGISE